MIKVALFSYYYVFVKSPASNMWSMIQWSFYFTLRFREEDFPLGNCPWEERWYLTDPVYLGLFYNHLRNSLTDRVTHPFSPNLQNTINTKPLQLGTWNFDTMFTTCHMSCVTCHVSRVMCHLRCVTCHLSPVKRHFLSIFFY